MIKISGVGTLMAVLCFAPCQTPETFLLRLRPKAGQPSHEQFDVHFETINQPGTLDLSLKVKSEFLQQTPAGYEWKYDIEKASAAATGAYLALAQPELAKELEGKTYVVVFDAKGNVLSEEPPNSDPTSVTQMIFPDSPVGVGSKWSQPFSTPKGPRRMDFTFSKIVSEDGVREALIDSMPHAEAEVSFGQPAQLWINIDSGELMRYQASATTGAGMTAIRAKTSFVRTYDKPEILAKY